MYHNYGYYPSYSYPNTVMPYPQVQDMDVRQESPKPKMHAIAQPNYVNQSPAAYTDIHPVKKIPQSNRYVTNVNPVFLDHLSRHQGLDITVQTSAKEVKGKLAGVAIDHIQLNIGKDRALHIRLDEIVYFEGLPLE